MDGLSAATNVIAVLQLTGSAINICYEYIKGVKNARKDVRALIDELKAIQFALGRLEVLVLNEPNTLPTVRALLASDGLLTTSKDELEQLQGKLKLPDRAKDKLLWPLEKRETDRLLSTFQRMKTTLGLALQVDDAALSLDVQKGVLALTQSSSRAEKGAQEHMSMTSALQKDVSTLSSKFSQKELAEKMEKVQKWLSSPDPSSNHSKAHKTQNKSTGKWFISGEVYTNWKHDDHSSIWVHGKPGAGKSILCSSVIEDIMQQSEREPGSAYAYFYFDFRDQEKQQSDKMICSLISQLLLHNYASSEAFESLCSQSNSGRKPRSETLLLVLRKLLSGFERSYIILDALDECIDRDELMENLKEISEWNCKNLHILMTSRRESVIVESLDTWVISQVPMNVEDVNMDIQIYIQEKLQSDIKLRKWSHSAEVLAYIEKELMRKAEGMFRWVVCQLEQLKHCPTYAALKKVLNNLPKTLDETYERILQGIEDSCAEDAKKMLQWLACAVEPMSIAMLSEVVAMNLEDEVQFHELPDPMNVLYICSSLVTCVDMRTAQVDIDSDFDSESESVHGSQHYDQMFISLAHFSVKEYLLSTRIKQSPAAFYSFTTIEAEITIAQVSLTYLLQFDKEDSWTEMRLKPLGAYAARHWMDHVAHSGKQVGTQLCILILQLFKIGSDTYRNWQHMIQRSNFEFQYGCSPNPIYYIACYGWTTVAAYFLEHMEELEMIRVQTVRDDRAMASDDIEELVNVAKRASFFSQHHMSQPSLSTAFNAPGGRFGNPLQAASFWGHIHMVQLLLNYGANIHIQGQEDGNALQIASSQEHTDIVQLLLNHGADVNAQGGKYGNALQVAAYQGHRDVVPLLLDHGADVNVQGGEYGNALQAASYSGNVNTVQLLLSHSADVNMQGGKYLNALQAATYEGHGEVVHLLLGHGADVNVQDEVYGSALQAASHKGYLKVVQLLLNYGADVNAQGGKYGNALQAATYQGHGEVVELLLDHGADVNVQGGVYGTALQTASYKGYLKIVQLLLDYAADVNVKGGEYGTALQTASYRGYLKVVLLLLDHGADVNVQDGEYKNALQAASYKGHLKIVQLLLDHGADVNAQGGRYSNSLQAALIYCHVSTIELLLNHGADVNTQGGRYGNALQAASYKGSLTIMQLLLDHGADVNVQGGVYGNALQAASHKGYLKVVQLLLNHGADVNAQGGKYGNPLQAAANQGCGKVVQLLLNHGADVNVQGGVHGDALQAASYKGYLKIVQLLLDHGADVNAQGGRYSNSLQAALIYCHVKTIELLLNHGADVNTQGEKYGNALQAASYSGNVNTVQLLLSHGADVNMQGGKYVNALQAATYEGHGEVVQILLDHGADINMQGGVYGNALQAASHKGHLKVVQLLLNHGADINAQGGKYRNALQAASYQGHTEIVQLLLDHGADIDSQGAEYGNAL